MKKKIKPVELTSTQQFLKWQAFFRNTEKMDALRKKMSDKKIDEKKSEIFWVMCLLIKPHMLTTIP